MPNAIEKLGVSIYFPYFLFVAVANYVIFVTCVYQKVTTQPALTTVYHHQIQILLSEDWRAFSVTHCSQGGKYYISLLV